MACSGELEHAGAGAGLFIDIRALTKFPFEKPGV
jgi:hypothetical protein